MPVLLATKLHLPQVDAEAIVRPRLLGQLTRGLDSNVTLISAPAGYGKTTLAATWLRAMTGNTASAATLQAAWYSIDETDDDPTTFFNYFTVALRAVYPGSCPQAHAMAGQLEHATAEQLAVTLAAECLLLPAKTILVLDDLHLVTNPVIHRALTHLVRYASPRLHLVAITRSDPPWPVARLRAQRQLSEVRVHDLQFTREETSGLFAVTFERPLDQAALDRLHRQTEGWVAGLQLAAIGIQARAAGNLSGDNMQVDDVGYSAGRYTIDYLVDEALEGQPATIQRFLLTTALLERFTAPLAAQVLEDVDTAACAGLIAEIERRNLFVTPLDDTRTWYRYHHQFAEMLRMRGRFGDQQRKALHLRAAEWLAANGSEEEALRHFAAAGAVDALMALIERQLPAAYNANRWHDLARWLAHVPDRQKLGRPLLILAQCTLLEQEAHTAGMAALLDRAKVLLAHPACDLDPGQRRLAEGQIYLLSGETLPDLCAEERVTYAQRALEVLPADQHWLRGTAFIELAMWLDRLGRREAAIERLRAELVARPGDSEELHLRLLIALGSLEYQSGSMLELRRYGEEILHAQANRPLTFSITTAHYGLGTALHQAGELEVARKHLELVMDWPHLTHHQIRLQTMHILLLLNCATGQPDQAAAAMRNFRRFAAGDGSPIQAELMAAQEALAALVTGDLAAAAEWAARPMPDGWLGTFDHRLVVQARILLAQDTPSTLVRAHDLLSAYRTERAAQHQTREVIEASVLLAHVAWRQGRKAEALDLLAETISRGYPLGYRQWFVEPASQAGAMLQALAQTRRCQQEVSVLLTLLDAAKQRTAAPVNQMVTTPDGEIIEPLTERELAVLAALGQRLSNKEIARSLGVSPLTVRNHTSHIYAKLHVKGRQQAIARAQVLGLLNRAPA